MDLAEGVARESAAVKALARCHVEHKKDHKARGSGHLFIEYKQKGRPSGIATTTADYWMIEIHDDVWILLRTSLLRVAVDQAVIFGKVAKGGDYDQYDGALVPIEWLSKGLLLVR